MVIINEIYYFMNTNLNTIYSTLWRGYFKYIYNNETHIISGLDIDNILVDICDINFYLHIEDQCIFISLCQDEKYYIYQFEKHCKKIVEKIEEICDINITYGDFNATELKHDGNQYKYTITRAEDKKIILKKRVLNWEVFEKKRKEHSVDYEQLENSMKKMNIRK